MFTKIAIDIISIISFLHPNLLTFYHFSSSRHINADSTQIVVHGTEVDCILEIPEIPLSSLPPYGTGEEAHTTIMQSFNSLSKQLRNLNNLPLLIASIQGSSPSFRFSEVRAKLSLATASRISMYVIFLFYLYS